METLLITHPSFHLHEMGPHHPESPARLKAIKSQLLESGLWSQLQMEQARAASDEDLLRVHDAEYLSYLASKSPSSGYCVIDADTILNEHTLEAARFAAGAGLVGIDAIMQSRARAVFCAVRPPGHHATPNRAMGFCFYNNVAVAVAYALEKYELERVALVDFDVHHGNGSEDMFAGHSQVLMCGFYQHPFYPGGAHEPAAKNMVNIPVRAHSSAQQVRELVAQHWLPRLHDFSPQILFFSAGFDAHAQDSMAQLQLLETDFQWITEQVMQSCLPSTRGRVLSMLEGGYDGPSLGRSVEAHIRALVPSVKLKNR